MADDALLPTLPTDPQASGQSPLDILEDILKQNKEDKELVNSAEQQAEELQQQEMLAQKAASQQADAAALTQQYQALNEVLTTPQIQERQRQIEQDRQRKEQEKNDADGYQVLQLTRTKI